MSHGPYGRGARYAIAVTTLLLGGCATFSDDGGFSRVESEVREKLGHEARWSKDPQSQADARTEVSKLLAAPLTPDTSMQIALLANPRLQAEFANLGISEADLVQAGRIPNPGFSFGKTSGGAAQEIERGLHFNLMAVLTLPLRVGIETRRFEAAQMAAAGAAVEVALEARGAFFDAVAATQSIAYFREVVESADASRELMSRMRRVGNASRLDLAREQLFHAEAVTSVARAVRQESAAREALVRSLGLWGDQLAFRIPERLPELPDAPAVIEDIERTAIAQRLDIRQARHALDGVSANLGLTEATRFINVLEVGPAQVRDRGEEIRDGYEISLEIPIFDWGGARVARAEAVYMQAAERLRATAVDARSQVRQAYVDYRTAYDVAKHYRDEIVPLRKRISDEQLLRYNGMLISVFELIADAREQVAAVSAYVDALRDFWLAENALKTAMLTSNAPMISAGPAGMPAAGGSGGH
jgi:outer membrane protein TolC